MTTIAQLSQTLRTLFTTTADALARRSGFTQRCSKLTGSAFAQALVFAWLANPQATLEALAQAAAVAGVAISPQGLDQRFTEDAAIFLEQLLGAAIHAVVAAEPVAVPLLQRFSAVVLLDSSTIVLPAALAPWWPGCGGSGSTAHTAAALKLHVQYELVRGTLTGPLLTDGRTHESSTALQTAPLPPGALRVSDLGFFDLDVLAAIAAQDGFWLSRLKSGTAVLTSGGTRQDVPALLAAQDAAAVDLPVQLGVRHQLVARLLAVRVPPEVSAQRRRHVRRHARDHGRTPTAVALAWADWTLLVTNAPSTLLSLREALVLLRARWQIELLFKLWKSHGQIDQSRSAQPWRVLTEVFAKLLAMVVQHWVLLLGSWPAADRSLVKAAQTVRQHAFHLASALPCPLLLGRALDVIRRSLAAGCRINPRKTHPNTYQLLLDPALAGLA